MEVMLPFRVLAENDSTSLCLTDADDDGYAPISQSGTDCDDGDDTEKPGVIWYADLDGDTFAIVQMNVNEYVLDVLDSSDCDDGDSGEKPGVTWYADVDGDTFGDPDSSNECERANVSDVLDSTDVMMEIVVKRYVDSDGDTFGDPDNSNECERANVSDVLDSSDCDDGDAERAWCNVDGDGDLETQIVQMNVND